MSTHLGGARSPRIPAAVRRRRAKTADERADEPRAGAQSKPAKPRARALAVRLAGEVERLAAELERSLARIADLEAKAEIDPLTELLNRRGFMRELKRALAYVERYGVSAALLFLDLDGFKAVNDHYGHAAGDALLIAAGRALLRHVRASDVVARLGGDEFVVLLWNISGAAALAKAAALEGAILAAAVQWGASTLSVSASAGVALIGALDEEAELLARADAAMYARKAARRRGAF